VTAKRARTYDGLALLTDQLVNRADAEVAQGVADTRDAYARSQIVVVTFAGASLLFALVLALVIALSILGGLMAARTGRPGGWIDTRTSR